MLLTCRPEGRCWREGVRGGFFGAQGPHGVLRACAGVVWPVCVVPGALWAPGTTGKGCPEGCCWLWSWYWLLGAQLLRESHNHIVPSLGDVQLE